MSFFISLQITFGNDIGRFDLEVTTFQMAVLFAWNQRPKDRISYESLKLATELPDTELRRTLWVGNTFQSQGGALKTRCMKHQKHMFTAFFGILPFNFLID